MLSAIRSTEQQFFDEAARFEKLRDEVSKLTRVIEQYDSQLQENNLVKREMALLDGSDNIYKLVGPVLVKQNLDEARTNVDARIDFITKEMTKQEAVLKDTEDRQQALQEKLQRLQESLRKMKEEAAAKK
eukprot:m.32479 g.32479  ORF g.32479 m.32479 type:complete len:130 (-) comp10893_c0_seq1:139-528(-)